MLETIKNGYVFIAVVVFTFCVSVWGHTPAGWALAAIGWLTHHAPHIAVGN